MAGPLRRTFSARDGLRLSALEWPGLPDGGGKMPLLCLPGVARTALDFMAIGDRHARTRRVVALDYAGHGESERASDPGRYRVQVALRDLLDALAALHLHRVVLLGTSFGGILAMSLAVLRPGALAAVALGVGVFVGRPDTAALTAHDITASHVRALLGARETDVVSSDRHTVKPWFNGRIDYAPPVADLAARGFPLVGGRLDYIDGRPVAVLVYRSSQHPVDLYVRPEAGSDTEPAVRTERGYQLVVWRNAGMGYWAITDASADVAQAFARALRGG